MNNFKSHFIYDSRKRSGILLFAILIVGCMVTVGFYNPDAEIISSPGEEAKVRAFQREIDSLKAIEIANRKPKIFPFNPTLLTDFNGYKLGMSTEEVDRVIRFRESGKWFNSAAEFQRTSGISDSLLAVISPYFKWPKWLEEQRKNSTKKASHKKKWKTTEEKGKLNTLTYEEMIRLEGVDETAATKVIRHRDKIGGYQVDFQIYGVYGVSKEVKRAVLNHYTVKEKPAITYVVVNKASASDLSTVPSLNFELAKEIVDYRVLHEGIKSLEELKDIEGMTDYIYDIIKLYLHIN